MIKITLNPGFRDLVDQFLFHLNIAFMKVTRCVSDHCDPGWNCKTCEHATYYADALTIKCPTCGKAIEEDWKNFGVWDCRGDRVYPRFQRLCYECQARLRAGEMSQERLVKSLGMEMWNG